MTPERNDNPSNPRQKIIIGAIAIVLLVVLYNVFALFSGDSGGEALPPPPPAAARTAAATPRGSAPAATPSMPTNPSNPANAAAQLQNQQMVQPKVVAATSNEILRMQQADQAKYITLVNQLQMLRIEREIWETKQAIAAAKLAKVTTETNISEIITGPSPEASTAPTGPALVPMDEPRPFPRQAAPAPPPEPPNFPYALLSVSFSGNKWNAVLDGGAENLYTVAVGDSLPDGSAVAAIGKDYIVLKRDKITKRISIIKVMR